jgi:hypothetical protein
LIIASYYWALHVSPGSASALYWTANGVLVAGCLVTAARNAALRPILLILAASGGAGIFADVSFYVLSHVGGAVAYPSITDIGYVATYPLTALSLLLVVRRRTPGWDAASAIDAAIVAVSGSYIIFAFVIAPTMHVDVGHLARLVSLSYPVGDLMLIMVGARLMLGAGPRTTSLRMIGAYLALKLVADTVYSITVLNGTYDAGNFLDAIWMSATFTLAAAVLHPDVRQMVAPSAAATPDASVGRLTVLAIAAVIAPTVMVVQYLRDVDPHVMVAGLVCNLLFLLVLGRWPGWCGRSATPRSPTG